MTFHLDPKLLTNAERLQDIDKMLEGLNATPEAIGEWQEATAFLRLEVAHLQALLAAADRVREYARHAPSCLEANVGGWVECKCGFDRALVGYQELLKGQADAH